MKNNKPIFNVCLKVILPILIVLTALIMALTYRMVWKSCNTVSAADKETSESGELMAVATLQAKEDGKYYELYEIDDRSEIIAFCVTQEQQGQIPYMLGSYYPVAYWSGQYQVMDLSHGYEPVDSPLGRHGNHYQYWQGQDPGLSQVKVYDFSAYRGHTQSMGRGPGLGLIILWLSELMVGGFLILMNLIGGFIILGINISRKKNK